MQCAHSQFPWRLAAVVAAATAGIGAGGLFYAHSEGRRLLDQEQEQEQLTAIAKLKIGQISKWRRERIGDAVMSVTNLTLVAALFTDVAQADPAFESNLQVWARALQDEYGYTGVFVIDLSGRSWFSSRRLRIRGSTNHSTATRFVRWWKRC